jgi:LemA protein
MKQGDRAVAGSLLAARFKAAAGALALGLSLGGCGLRDVPALDGRARQAWSEVQAQYQRRVELVPPVIEAARSAAGQEREVVAEVVASRMRALRSSGDAHVLRDPEAFRNLQEAQDRLSSALRRLFATMERYPEVKSSSIYAAARAQIETTENRIAVARRDYVEAAQAFNEELRRVPDRWIAAFLYPEAEPFPLFNPTARSD